MKTLQDRLAQAFPIPRPRGLQARIMKLCGVSGATVSNWFKNPEKVSSMSRSHAELICAEFKLQVSPLWLAEGKGSSKPDASWTPPSLHSKEIEQTANSGQLVDLIVEALSRVPNASRKSVAEDLALLALAPDSPSTKSRLAAYLEPARNTHAARSPAPQPAPTTKTAAGPYDVEVEGNEVVIRKRGNAAEQKAHRKT